MVQQIQGIQPRRDKKPATKTYKPMFDKLVVWIVQAPNETDSGIVLPEKSAQTFVTMRAKVIAMGPECKSQVRVGDIVLLPGGSYEPIRHKGQETFVVGEKEIFGIEIPAEEVAK